jgi:formate dehydrogenase iron-sulfur subunit
MSKSILFDSTACVGCGECRNACKVRNGLPPGEETELSDKAVNVVKEYKVEDDKTVYVRKFCMHCNEPTCASVCPVAAFEKTSIGPVIYHKEKCMGCRYCMIACPFQVPRYEWHSALPIVRKCDMCYDRITDGKLPACVEACQFEASIFGERDELIQRVKDKGLNIYGDNIIGGTSVIIAGNVDFGKLGFRMDLPKEPLPMLTWNILSKIPSFVLLGGTLLSGIWWITNRRREVEEFEKGNSSNY